jgi:hypothetical protein
VASLFGGARGPARLVIVLAPRTLAPAEARALAESGAGEDVRRVELPVEVAATSP